MPKYKVDETQKLLPFLKGQIEMPAKRLRWLVEHNRCRVNGRVERFCSTRLVRGDQVQLFLDEEKSTLEIVFEDEHLVIYNKPPQMPSEKLPHLAVHRIDRDTTGLIIRAKTLEAQNKMEELFRDREVEKEYTAIVAPPPTEERGVIKMKMAVHKRREGAVLWKKAQVGLSSKTAWEVIKREKKWAELRLFPKTGRTHQLRLHMKELGCPIVGDPDYGDKQMTGRVFGQKLHARRLKFVHPMTGETVEVWKNAKY